jgi:hypothetical protein
VHKRLVLRNMTEADLPVALEWAAAEGWNPGLHDANCFYAADPEGFFRAELDGSAVRYVSSFGFLASTSSRPSIAGTASALNFGGPPWTIWATA